jgi:hypothetical protein
MSAERDAYAREQVYQLLGRAETSTNTGVSPEHVEIMKTALSLGVEKIGYSDGGCTGTPLCWLQEPLPEEVRVLLKKAPNVEYQDNNPNYKTPIWWLEI